MNIHITKFKDKHEDIYFSFFESGKHNKPMMLIDKYEANNIYLQLKDYFEKIDNEE